MTSTSAGLRDLRWFHSIDLGNGLITPGAKSAETLQAEAEVAFTYPVAGRSVLDIGAWDGFFSFEAERRGASRVLATDEFCWVGGGWGKKASFDFARRALQSHVEDMIIDPMDLSPERVGVFDVSLFLGVLYHLKHPLYVLERVAEVTRGLLVLETHVDMTDVEHPAAAFYPGKELGGDDTNWWGPNIPAVIGMLKTAGFGRVEHRPCPIQPNRSFFHAWK
jgi:tRNA (mo5U34)-methyltransferase